MAYLKDLEPQLMDKVKNKICPGYSGTVITKYMVGNTVYLDVRDDSMYIYFGTPAVNWEVTKLNDEAT